MRSSIFSIIAIVALLTGCIARLDPAWLEDRAVQPAADPKKTFTVIDGMVFQDSVTIVARGIRFPPGVYTLEAEDADYFYLRSPSPLEFRTFKNGQMTDGRNIPGGLMIAKHFSLIPAAGYIDGEGPKKMAVWKLGSEFLALRGRYWRQSF